MLTRKLHRCGHQDRRQGWQQLLMMLFAWNLIYWINHDIEKHTIHKPVPVFIEIIIWVKLEVVLKFPTCFSIFISRCIYKLTFLLSIIYVLDLWKNTSMKHENIHINFTFMSLFSLGRDFLKKIYKHYKHTKTHASQLHCFLLYFWSLFGTEHLIIRNTA